MVQWVVCYYMYVIFCFLIDSNLLVNWYVYKPINHNTI
jgi:hypothetical protein